MKASELDIKPGDYVETVTGEKGYITQINVYLRDMNGKYNYYARTSIEVVNSKYYNKRILINLDEDINKIWKRIGNHDLQIENNNTITTPPYMHTEKKKCKKVEIKAEDYPNSFNLTLDDLNLEETEEDVYVKTTQEQVIDKLNEVINKLNEIIKENSNMNYDDFLDFINGKIWFRFTNQKDWDYIIELLKDKLNITGDINYLKDNFNYYDCLKLDCDNNGLYTIRTNYYDGMRNVCLYERNN